MDIPAAESPASAVSCHVAKTAAAGATWKVFKSIGMDATSTAAMAATTTAMTGTPAMAMTTTTNAATINAQPYPREALLTTTASPNGFSPREFVESRLGASRSTGGGDALETIASRLDATVRGLTDELLRVIDKDHQVFLELSSDLVRVDATVQVLRGPLTNLRERVEAVRRAAAAPLEVARDFERQIDEVRAKRRQVEDERRARALREAGRRDAELAPERAAHILAALEAPNATMEADDAGEETEELRRVVEAKLVAAMLESGSASSQRALAAMSSVAAARRAFAADLKSATHASDSKTNPLLIKKYSLETKVVRHALSKRSLLESSMQAGVSRPLDLLASAAWPASREGTEIRSVQDAKRAEALRVILAAMSVSGRPHGLPRWNPRMHCELVFQDAVKVLESCRESPLPRAKLDEAVGMLFAGVSMPPAASETVLAARLFRMACELVTGFVDHYEKLLALAPAQAGTFATVANGNANNAKDDDATAAPGAADSRTRAVGTLRAVAEDLTSARLIPSIAWGGETQARAALAQYASSVAAAVVHALAVAATEACLRELAALERADTSAFRMTGKPPPTSASPHASRVAQPAIDALAALPDMPETKQFRVRVARDVAVQFQTLADQVVKREENVLRLHHRSAKGGASATVSDSEKIMMQLRLDAELVRDDLLRSGRVVRTGVDDDAEAAAAFAQVVEMLSRVPSAAVGAAGGPARGVAARSPSPPPAPSASVDVAGAGAPSPSPSSTAAATTTTEARDGPGSDQ